MSKPINIIFRDDNNNIFIQYIYELTLTFKDNTQKVFKEICNMKHCKIITFNNMIPFNMIEKYNMDITQINFTNNIYNINNFIGEEDTHISKNDDIYIEFIQNNDKNTSCCCYLKVNDSTRLFITPPNY